MQEGVTQIRGGEAMLETLEGTVCSYCELGRLDLRSYKGNDAAVCTECGVPAAQVW
ncbi:HVO_A0556 family zinc finger protein [Natronosalvus caseinilyticus]|uniref:HVO_A0556 family zinc finger protein n=1 Tax=Natronosalvus caseinilyticus TaxID=2953747 RepID=UPI0028A6A5CD|nr:HVO_A0556 family zinc finger protein [Natronosalvus caseinilyticus]